MKKYRSSIVAVFILILSANLFAGSYDYVIKNNKRYYVNMTNKIDHKNREVENAKWFVDLMGGKLVFLPTINEDGGVSCADYKYYPPHSNKWYYLDNKETTGKGLNVFYHSLEGKDNQSNIFLIDCTYSYLSNEEILDEFKNIGEIPNFKTIISTCRKYRIGVMPVIQDIAQLKELYPDDEHQTIMANVDTTLFLGSILVDDKEEIQRMLGKTTIQQKSTSGSKQGASTSYTPTEVDVMSLDEIGAINEDGRNDCIVIIRDLPAFLSEKLNMLEHPNFELLKENTGKYDFEKPFMNLVDKQVMEVIY